MVITEEILNKAMSPNGGWSAKQLRQIVPVYEYEGNRSFPRSGWKLRILGRNVSDDLVRRFLEYRVKDKREKTGNLFA